MTWTPQQIPDLTGQRFVVTGVTSGIGEQTAWELARRGADVVLAARSRAKLAATRSRIEDDVPDARLTDLLIDVSEMSSVRRAADQLRETGPIDCLINNAGVMATPYTRTGDNFELQLATNHFGPFLFTGLLLDQLAASGAGRVVAVASQAHRFARTAPLADPRREGDYSRWTAYAESKLANLLFTFELDRRARAAGLPIRALAAHPGYSATELVGTGRQVGGRLGGTAIGMVFKTLGQSPEMGAWPTLMAATAELPGSTYVGPDSFAQMRGRPQVVGCTRLAKDPDVAAQLWDLSEQATGIAYP
ncbi:MAG TPA: oxidoreductase [Marmoricola sp.]|nr:oxidoreductase [Marmoricola sp.]